MGLDRLLRLSWMETFLIVEPKMMTTTATRNINGHDLLNAANRRMTNLAVSRHSPEAGLTHL